MYANANSQQMIRVPANVREKLKAIQMSRKFKERRHLLKEGRKSLTFFLFSFFFPFSKVKPGREVEGTGRKERKDERKGGRRLREIA